MGEKKRRMENLENEAESLKKQSRSSVLGISRSISACQRCRVKKVKCDQQFPKCTKCVKAGVECVGLDPATGRDVPRSYISFLEDRLGFLETKIRDHGINLEDLDKSDRSTVGINPLLKQPESTDNMISNGKGSDTVSGTSSSISFAKLMATAVKVQKKSNVRPEDPSLSMRFEKVSAAILPPKQTALEFIKIFFAQSNSQLPILHREEFIKNYFVPVYGSLTPGTTLASDFTPINYEIFSKDIPKVTETWLYNYKRQFQEQIKTQSDATIISNSIEPPKSLHKALFFLNMVFAISSSVHHLRYPSTISESFQVTAKTYSESVLSSQDQLEALQGILLMNIYAIMRPAVPQVWYVLGTALRVCIDLNLHNESNSKQPLNDFERDKRRRLFWCTYSVDRQVCFYLNRPVGIPDECINTPFPSVLDDALIVRDHSLEDDCVRNFEAPSYKKISIAMFKMRRIQSEVQKVLYEKAEVPRSYRNFDEWKRDIEMRLNVWRESCPKVPEEMNCDFNLVFFDLNYYHTLLILHGLSPKQFRLSSSDFMIVSEASKQLINCYSKLHETKSINYTWAAVHNLFMAGTSYLYTVYSSQEVRKSDSLNEVKIVSSNCLKILATLISECDATAACSEIFENLTMAIVKLKYNEFVKGCSTTVLNEKFSQINNSSLNSNVKQLVQNINEANNSYNDSSQMFKSLNPFHDLGELDSQIEPHESQVAVQRLLEKKDDFKSQKSPSFEWISKNPLEFDIGNSKFSQQIDLDLFFNELESLSPSRSKNELGESKSSLEQRHSHIPPDQDSAMSSTRSDGFTFQEGQISPNPPSQFQVDGKKVYELINQMPTDSIWDQYFTGINPNVANNLNDQLGRKVDIP